MHVCDIARLRYLKMGCKCSPTDKRTDVVWVLASLCNFVGRRNQLMIIFVSSGKGSRTA